MDKTTIIEYGFFIFLSIIIVLIIIFADDIVFSKTSIAEEKHLEVVSAPVVFNGEVTIVSVPLSEEEKIDMYVDYICEGYPVDPNLVKSIIFYESTYNSFARNGQCVGLMQINTYYHSRRAKELGISDLYSPYGNILVGVDYLSVLFKIYKDPALVLMVYNMGDEAAINLYNKGVISEYASKVLKRAEEIKKEKGEK